MKTLLISFALLASVAAPSYAGNPESEAPVPARTGTLSVIRPCDPPCDASAIPSAVPAAAVDDAAPCETEPCRVGGLGR